jgi:mRNA interferase MazF
MTLPDEGDILWLELGAPVGTEQARRRPGLVLSSLAYHERSARALICPITSSQKPWGFHVALPGDLRTKGCVQVDQVRMVDRSRRLFGLIERAPERVVVEVRLLLAALAGIPVQPS